MKKVILVIAALLLVYAAAATVAANRQAPVREETRFAGITEKIGATAEGRDRVADLFREMEEASGRGDYQEAMRIAEQIRQYTDEMRSR